STLTASTGFSTPVRVERRAGAPKRVTRTGPRPPFSSGTVTCSNSSPGGCATLIRLPRRTAKLSRRGRALRLLLGKTVIAAPVGMDISTDTLDACLRPGHGRPLARCFRNDEAGHAELLAWADARAKGAGFCLESTGACGAALATALAQAGRHVSVVNPARIKYAGLMRGQGNKTDKADAKLIAEYAARERPPACQPAPAEAQELQALVRRR